MKSYKIEFNVQSIMYLQFSYKRVSMSVNSDNCHVKFYAKIHRKSLSVHEIVTFGDLTKEKDTTTCRSI